jgi:hypothetical protein
MAALHMERYIKIQILRYHDIIHVSNTSLNLAHSRAFHFYFGGKRSNCPYLATPCRAGFKLRPVDHHPRMELIVAKAENLFNLTKANVQRNLMLLLVSIAWSSRVSGAGIDIFSTTSFRAIFEQY